LQSQSKEANFGRISRNSILLDSFWDVPIPLRMKMETKKREWAIQVSCLTMLMVFNKLERLMDFNLLELEILGVKENGLVSSQTRTRLGMIIKD
jgi:hypothetical protein